MTTERLVINRYCYTHEPAGSDNEVQVDNSVWCDSYKVGGTIVLHVAAPGYGRIIYRVTKVDQQRAWGVVTEDTSGILTPEDIR